jgi:transcriptional regulator with XRE-family HTH domain
METCVQEREAQELSLDQRLLLDSEESAGEYLLAAWFYRAMEEIRETRLRQGLTQQDVADRIGTTQSVIARLENSHEGNFSLKRFLEYAWASGAAPLDFSCVSRDQLRSIAFLDPSAPRTLDTIRSRRLMDAIKNWGLDTSTRAAIGAARRREPINDSAQLHCPADTRTATAKPKGDEVDRPATGQPYANAISKPDIDALSAAEPRGSGGRALPSRLVAA